jgi:drug/metabolite transporter (DMT)-like permease
LFSAVMGFAFFAEVPGGWTLAGAALIVASTIYIARREAKVRG